MKLKTCSLAVLGIAAALPSLFANVLTPGNTVSPDVFTATSGFTLLASTSSNINPIPGSSFNATYQESVVRDVNNIYCSTCLDFLIFASNAGPGIFERLSTSAFAGFLTDVGYTATPSGVTPVSVDRSGNGNVIGFNFIPPGSSVDSAQSTAILEIQTNATNYTAGLVSIQDGSSGFGAGFAPTSTPEPVSMTLFGTGLLAIGTSKKLKNLLKKSF